MMRKRYSLRKRLIMAMRDIRDMAKTSVTCPGCGSSNVNGGPPWSCGNCGSLWQ